MNQITVKVQGPQKKGGHRIYSIVGSDKNGEFNTVKRFSDFDQLRKILGTKWPGCYIPSLPQKKIVGNQDPTLLEMRKKCVNYFMNYLKNLQNMWYSEETQIFLHKIGDTEKELQKLKESSVVQILEKYRVNFPNLINKQVTDGARDKLRKLNQDFKKMKQSLQSLDKKVGQVDACNKKYDEKFLTLIDSLLPDYEKNCLQVYKNGSEFQEMIFTGPKKERINVFCDKLKHNARSTFEIVCEIKRQKQEIQSFEDLLKAKQQYMSQRQKILSKIKDLEIETSKIHGGKESFMSKIKNKTKDQQLKDNQTHIQKAQQQEKNLISLYNVISLLLTQTQIQRFKKQRISSYYSLLRSIFAIQKQTSQIKKQFWSLIMKQNCLEKEQLDNFFQSPSKKSATESPSKQLVEEKQQDQEKQTDQQQKQQKEKFNNNNDEVQIQEVQQISNDQQQNEQQKDKEEQQQHDKKEVTE